MLCTFTTEHGTLIIRSEDIRAISDGSDESTLLRWEMCGAERSARITGTALENHERLSREELDVVARVEGHRYETQRRLSEGYPVPPIVRGKTR